MKSRPSKPASSHKNRPKRESAPVPNPSFQSANEELGTLNAELRSKNSELRDLSNDILNLLNSTRIPVVMLDLKLSIRRITPAAAKLFKLLPADIGRPFTDIKLNIDESDMTSHDLELQIANVLASLQPIEREVRDLEGRWHALSILPYRTQENKIDGIVLALQEIHAVKSANEQLAKSANFFRGIIDTVREPLLVLDHEQRVVDASRSFLRTFEVSLEQTVNRTLYELGDGQWNIPALRSLLERVLPEEQAVTDFELDHDYESIGHKTMLLNARRLVQPDQLQPMILLAIEDITERRKAAKTRIENERLTSRREELRALNESLEKAREEERTRVARDLHDDIGQILTAVRMDLAWIGRHLPERESEVLGRIQGAAKLVSEGAQSVRKICAGLRPQILDDLGLVAAIEWQSSEFASRTGIPCQVSAPKDPLPLDNYRATALFRIFQECLTNVARHANAKSVRASLFSQADDLVLAVQDDGKGFEESKTANSLGILGMRERAQAWGGYLEISSAYGKGTTVTVRVPMHVPGANNDDRAKHDGR